MSRDRRGELYNSEAARRTGKMLAAAFVHETSRAKDPSLHTHVLIANVTIDPERNEALAISYGEMLEMRKTLDARTHNNLARRLSALGYTVEVAEHGFRLRDIPAPIEEIYSVRNREIATAKELLREGYTVQQLGEALRDRPVKEKSELWVSGKIRGLLNSPKLPSNRSIDIFQGDTQQLPAVGRGQPLAMLERELGFGMHVGRINVTRRQLKLEDKRVAQELSSGDAARFSAAIETLIERGGIRRGGITESKGT